VNTLIVVASRHGSTSGIAEVVAQELRTAGHAVEVTSVDNAPPVESYDAVIIGSAVYLGNWLPRATEFLERHKLQLRKMPVWLFSSGPLGDRDAQTEDEPTHLDLLLQQSGARGHQTFFGKLDMNGLGLAERFMVWNVNRLKSGGAPQGDFRHWDEIRAWAHEISSALAVEVGAGV
jgi:menaquinone-dependent protoporphyrinogen oxidase